MRILGISRAVTAAFALVIATSAFAADDGVWSVKKTSGDVWMSNGSDVHQASVKSDEVLKPGDTVTTGKNGRVLLVRGEESILVAPNSVIGLPAEKKEGLSTTIKQQAGSILLEVEKKNVKHFEVETPYLAAVVKGTQFRVTVNASGATVDVVRGQVEVADFKTGQIAQVMPGQHANVFANGNAGLTLGGAGALEPIQQGQPRASSVDRVPVPRNGLTAPGKPTSASLQQHRHNASGPRHGVVRISASLGEVKLNVHRATHGLARNAGVVPGSRAAGRDNATVWDTASSSNGNASSGNGNGNGGAASAAAGSAGSVTSTVAAVVGAANGNGNGNGNAGGNGNHYGWVNGNNGNGNGNGNGRNR
jgi:FecR-like protein